MKRHFILIFIIVNINRFKLNIIEENEALLLPKLIIYLIITKRRLEKAKCYHRSIRLKVMQVRIIYTCTELNTLSIHAYYKT